MEIRLPDEVLPGVLSDTTSEKFFKVVDELEPFSTYSVKTNDIEEGEKGYKFAKLFQFPIEENKSKFLATLNIVPHSQQEMELMYVENENPSSSEKIREKTIHIKFKKINYTNKDPKVEFESGSLDVFEFIPDVYPREKIESQKMNAVGGYEYVKYILEKIKEIKEENNKNDSIPQQQLEES